MTERSKTILSWTFMAVCSLFFMSITVGLSYWMFDYKLFDTIPVWSIVLVYEILWYTHAFLYRYNHGSLEGIRTL